MSNIKVLFAYRDFHHIGRSTIGCGNGARGAVTVLNRAGILAESIGLWSKEDLAKALRKDPTITHCIVEALWLEIAEIESLCTEFSSILFVIRSHSAWGFMASELAAIKLVRKQITMQAKYSNLILAGNCRKFAEATSIAYNTNCLFLPNLYDMELPKTLVEPSDPGVLKVSSFSAMRVLKGLPTSAMAAMVAAKTLGLRLRFAINSGRSEGSGSNETLNALRAMFDGVDWAELIEVPWSKWEDFYKIVGQQDIGLAMSATESCHLISFDMMVQRLPIIVSDVVAWAPKEFKVGELDNPMLVAERMIELLGNRKAGDIGFKAAKKEVERNLRVWKQFLGIKSNWWF